MGANPPNLEFLRIIRKTSDFGVLNTYYNNIFKVRKASDFGVFAVGANPQNFEFLCIILRRFVFV